MAVEFEEAPKGAVELPSSGEECVCCRDKGRLPSVPVQGIAPGGMVDGSVVKQMCEACVHAAFLSGGSKPHPHPMEVS